MHALMLPHVDQFRGQLDGRKRRCDDSLRRRYKCDDGTVVIGIDMRVQHAGSRHGGDGVRQSLNRFSPAAFAEVWYTLDQRMADC